MGSEMCIRDSRKHVLTRTSPGGTTRSSEYVSPLKEELPPLMYNNGDVLVDSEERVDWERCDRRYDALRMLPCDQTDAQRSASARAKRKAPPQREAKRQPPLAAWDWAPPVVYSAREHRG